ncbi:MAG: carbohydrate ABC transporter permease [Actinomycetales bacterium]
MRTNSRWTPYLFVAPAFVIYGFTVLAPVIGTFGISFLKWNGYGTPNWVGLRNYLRALKDSIFISSFEHVFIYIAATIILEVTVGLILAGILTSRRKTDGYRIALFVPVMLPMVIVAVLWRFVFNADFGLLNGILEKFGKPEWQQIWLGDQRFALLAICFVSGWVYAGFYLAIFYAGLQRLPREIVESAALDGANQPTIFWKIKVPMIRRLWEVAILICITGGIQGFDLFYVMTNGGPFYSTEVPTTYMVRTVFRDQELGYGAALAIIVTVVVLLIGAIYSRIRKQQEQVEY